MRKHITCCIVLILAVTLTLSACSSNPRLVVDADEGTGNVNGNGPPVYHPPPDVEELTKPLEGELTLLALEWQVDMLETYVDLFCALQPGVQINVDPYRWITDTTQQQALMTRLMADPPDILSFNSEVLSFEKIAMDALFANLYDFMNGSRGVNQEDYYTNIFRAAEWRGGLYHLPLYADLRLGVLNERLLSAIGVDASQIATISIADIIDYYLRAVDAFPDEKLFPSRYFSTMQVLRMSRLYDIETGDVYADTPEMRELFERAITIPVDGEFIEFKPGSYSEMITINTEATIGEFLTGSNYLLRDMTDGGMEYITALWLQDHPDMQFSRFATVLSGDSENIGFASTTCMSILRDSANNELAWEFLRFIMEYEEELFSVPGYYPARSGLPINRARFENQTPLVLHSHYSNLMFTLAQLGVPTEEHQNRDVGIAMDYLRDYMGQLNYEIRYSNALLNSLVYPELWLLHSGQQDVARTLANIQNRLMLYVNE